MKNILAAILVIVLSGCMPSGSTTMLQGGLPFYPTPVERVQVFLDKPNRPYKVIALVSASAESNPFMGVADAQGSALQGLKQQAAFAGADGIIDIQREVLNAGSTSAATNFGYSDKDDGWGSSFGIGGVDASHSIVFTAKAIKFFR